MRIKTKPPLISVSPDPFLHGGTGGTRTTHLAVHYMHIFTDLFGAAESALF